MATAGPEVSGLATGLPVPRITTCVLGAGGTEEAEDWAAVTRGRRPRARSAARIRFRMMIPFSCGDCIWGEHTTLVFFAARRKRARTELAESERSGSDGFIIQAAAQLPARRVIALVGVDAGGGHLGLDDVIVVVEKADVVIVADALIVFGVTDEDVGGNGGIGERYVGGPRASVVLNGAVPTFCPTGDDGGFREHVVDEADAIKVAAVVTVFTPHNFARSVNVAAADDAGSLTEAGAVPLRQKRIGVFLGAPVQKVREESIVGSNDGAARLFKAAGADVVACDVTLGSAKREVCELERRLVPRHGAWTIAAAIQHAWKSPR